MRKIVHKLLLIEREIWSSDTQVLSFEAPELAGNWKPGQFLEISCGGLLFRPFAIMDEPAPGIIRIGVKMVGERSRYLCQLEAGTVLEAHAPLGNGWSIPPGRKVLALAGGSGIFPMITVLKQAAESMLICGFRNPESAYDKKLPGLPQRILYSSDTGGLDFYGNAYQALLSYINEHPIDGTWTLLACGPKALLKSCQSYALEKHIDCQLSLEEHMACGLGLCLGCAVDVRDEQGNLQRVRCCVEGPVFDARRVIL